MMALNFGYPVGGTICLDLSGLSRFSRSDPSIQEKNFGTIKCPDFWKTDKSGENLEIFTLKIEIDWTVND